MKRATIDIGTNSVRLLIADYENGAFYNAEKAVEITRLGKGVNETGRLLPDRVEATVAAVSNFYQKALSSGAETVDVMATSAARDASNRSELVEAIADRTGMTLAILSGDEEASIGFLGVVAGLEPDVNRCLVIDIGGGSTELIVGDRQGIAFGKSLDIGAVRLTGAFVKGETVAAPTYEAIKQYALDALSTVQDDLKAHAFEVGVGIGGTAATYITMAHRIGVYTRAAVHGQTVTLETVRALNRKLGALSLEERKAVVGLEPKRADVIVAGGIILEAVLECLGLEAVVFSDYDNLEGYMIEK